jgi:NADPH:quinone reductase-like Zn-dependent oxidoreductase
MGLMLAKFLGARSIATVGSKEKCEAAIRIGAHHAINYREQDFATEVGDLTRGRGADVVLDMVGGSYLERNLNALAVEGRIVIVATQGGRTGELDIGKLMHKRGRVIGSTMRARTPEEKGRVARALSEAVWPSLPARDPIRPVIDSTFPLRDAAQAHRRMESGEHIGKIVLVV